MRIVSLLLFVVLISGCTEKSTEDIPEYVLGNLKTDMRKTSQDLEIKIHLLGQHTFEIESFNKVKPYIYRSLDIWSDDKNLKAVIDSFKVFIASQEIMSNEDKQYISQPLDGYQGDDELTNLTISQIRYLRTLEKKIEDRYYSYEILEPLIVTDRPEYKKGEVVTGKVYLTAKSSTLRTPVYIGNPDSLIKNNNYLKAERLPANDSENFSTFNSKVISDTIQGIMVIHQKKKTVFLPFKHVLKMK